MKIAILALLVLCFAFGYQAMSRADSMPKAGDKAFDFNLPDAQDKMHRLSDYTGQWLVLYFYPKDDTPGCTKEACSFRDDLSKLEKMGAKVVGVSVDDTSSHMEFAKKYHLPFPLLSDKDGQVAAQYGALNNFGILKVAKRYTYLINPKGEIAKIYLSVDTSRHSQEIIEDLNQFTNK